MTRSVLGRTSAAYTLARWGIPRNVRADHRPSGVPQRSGLFPSRCLPSQLDTGAPCRQTVSTGDGWLAEIAAALG